MAKSKTRIYIMVRAALFAALLATTAQLSLPLPSGVPLTLQTFAVALTGFVLGMKEGGISVCVYVALGTLGLPVFAGFKGGISALVGPTGGFLYGFIIMAILSGTKKLPLAFLGLILCHVCGAVHFSVISGNSLLQSITLVSLPYILKDLLSVVAAYYLGKSLHKKITWQ